MTECVNEGQRRWLGRAVSSPRPASAPCGQGRRSHITAHTPWTPRGNFGNLGTGIAGGGGGRRRGSGCVLGRRGRRGRGSGRALGGLSWLSWGGTRRRAGPDLCPQSPRGRGALRPSFALDPQKPPEGGLAVPLDSASRRGLSSRWASAGLRPQGSPLQPRPQGRVYLRHPESKVNVSTHTSLLPVPTTIRYSLAQALGLSWPWVTLFWARLGSLFLLHSPSPAQLLRPKFGGLDGSCSFRD